MSTTKTGLRVHQKRSENKENMPQSSKIPVASSIKKKKSVKLTKARPVPDFGKLHQQWQGKLERGKALTKKPCTVAHEFDITKSGTKMKRAKSKTELNGDLDLNVDLNLADDLNPDIDYGSDLDFAVDQAALNSIITNKGVGHITGRATIAATHSAKPSSSKRQIFKELPPDGRQLGDQDKTRKRKGSSLADLQQEEGIDFEVDSAALQSIVTNQGLSREDVFGGPPGVCSSIQRQTLAGPATFKTPVSAAPRTLNHMSARPSIYYQKSPFESKARMFRAHSEFQKRTLSKISASTPGAPPGLTREAPVKESDRESPLGTGIRVVRRPDSIYVRTVSTRKGPCGDLDLGPTGTAPTPSAALGPPKRVPVPQSPSACRVPKGTTPKSKVKVGSRSDVTWADLLSPASAENQQNQEESCQKKDSLAMTLFTDDDTNYQTPHCVPLGVLEESPTCTSQGGSPLGVEDTEGHRQRLEEIREMERLLEMEIAAMETTDTKPVKLPKNPLVPGANNSPLLQERPQVTESVGKDKNPSVSESVKLQNSPLVTEIFVSQECPVFQGSEMGKFKPVQWETETLFKQQHQQQNMALHDTGHKHAVTSSADIQQSNVLVRPQLSSLAERWQQQGAVSNNHSSQAGAVEITQEPGHASVYQLQFLHSDQHATQPLCDSKMAMGIPMEEMVSNSQRNGMYGSHGGHLALDDLNQSIRDSEEQFEELETCARMLQQSARQSGTGGGGKSAEYIWKQLEMVKKQQEELLKFQQQLQQMLAMQQHQQSQQLQPSTASQHLSTQGQHHTTQQQQQYFEQLPRIHQQISGQPQQGVITLQYQQRQQQFSLQHGSQQQQDLVIQQQMQQQPLLKQCQQQEQQSSVYQHQQPSSTNLQSVHHNFMYSQQQETVGLTQTQQYPFQPSVDENQCLIQHNGKQIASQVLATSGDAAKTGHVELNLGELTGGQRLLIQTANSAFSGLDLMNDVVPNRASELAVSCKSCSTVPCSTQSTVPSQWDKTMVENQQNVAPSFKQMTRQFSNQTCISMTKSPSALSDVSQQVSQSGTLPSRQAETDTMVEPTLKQTLDSKLPQYFSSGQQKGQTISQPRHQPFLPSMTGTIQTPRPEIAGETNIMSRFNQLSMSVPRPVTLTSTFSGVDLRPPIMTPLAMKGGMGASSGAKVVTPEVVSASPGESPVLYPDLDQSPVLLRRDGGGVMVGAQHATAFCRNNEVKVWNMGDTNTQKNGIRHSDNGISEETSGQSPSGQSMVLLQGRGESPQARDSELQVGVSKDLDSTETSLTTSKRSSHSSTEHGQDRQKTSPSLSVPQTVGVSTGRSRLAAVLVTGATQRFQEALLDEECALYACRLQTKFSPQPQQPRSCHDPVALVLAEGDDMHFIPIREDSYHPRPSDEGSAFSCLA